MCFIRSKRTFLTDYEIREMLTMDREKEVVEKHIPDNIVCQYM